MLINKILKCNINIVIELKDLKIHKLLNMILVEKLLLLELPMGNILPILNKEFKILPIIISNLILK